MRAVNLLPVDRKKGAKGAKGERGERKLSKLHGVGLVTLLLVGGMGYYGYGISSDAKAKALEADDLEAQVTALTAKVAAEQAKLSTKPQLAGFDVDKNLVIGLAQARVNWATVIVNLSRVAPAGVWLDSIQVQTPTGAAGGGTEVPTAITLEGKATSRTAAVQFLSRLDALPGFEEPRLQGGINPEETESGPTVFSYQVEIPINDGIFGPVKPTSAAAQASTTTPAATPSTPSPTTTPAG
jgi:Tfp pilus assembly protein PilN